ncbi:MAG TPA: TQO small subunit DoxD [Flavipsychrobacter sp.]
MRYNKITPGGQSFELAGLFTLALRLVTGWTYFSAFWRRLVLADKLDPDAAGYIGEKFNHFLPNALFIKPGIEYLVSNEQALWWFMLVFTIVEAVVGLLFILGFFTRLMSIGVFGLAMGILLGAGWLGTTCLDEWQIGVLGIAAGFTIFLSGGGRYSVDYYIDKQRMGEKWKAIFAKLGSGDLNMSTTALRRIALAGAVFIFLLTLGTNQYFHGGVWGKLHNLSVRPHITLSDATIQENQLAFTVFRDEGADVYGSFLIGVRLKNEQGTTVMERDARDLAAMTSRDIKNSYVAKVKTGKHSLVIPLGAKARLQFNDPGLSELPTGTYKVVLTDISGIEWEQVINIK